MLWSGRSENLQTRDVDDPVFSPPPPPPSDYTECVICNAWRSVQLHASGFRLSKKKRNDAERFDAKAIPVRDGARLYESDLPCRRWSARNRSRSARCVTLSYTPYRWNRDKDRSARNAYREEGGQMVSSGVCRVSE